MTPTDGRTGGSSSEAYGEEDVPGGSLHLVLAVVHLAEEDDRRLSVVEAVWPQVWEAFGVGAVPDARAVLDRAVEIEALRLSVARLGDGGEGGDALDPGYEVVPAEREQVIVGAGSALELFVMESLAGYWCAGVPASAEDWADVRAAVLGEANSEDAGGGSDLRPDRDVVLDRAGDDDAQEARWAWIRRGVIDAALSAAPYLRRLGATSDLSDLIDVVLSLDPPPDARRAVLAYLPDLADAADAAPSVLVELALVRERHDPHATVALLRRAVRQAAERTDQRVECLAQMRLADALNRLGRYAEAYAVNECARESAAEPDLGPWTRLALDVQRLRVSRHRLTAVDALEEAQLLVDRLDGLRGPDGSVPAVAETAGLRFTEVVPPRHVARDVLAEAVGAANDARRWEAALGWGSDAVALLRTWGAPEEEIATAHFRTYVPLKELGRFRAAETMLLYCQEVYEAAENTAGQARTAGALGRVAHLRGASEEALAYQHATLRLAYRTPGPGVLPLSHRYMSLYLPPGRQVERLAHGLAAALIFRFTGNEAELAGAMGEVAALDVDEALLAQVTPEWLTSVVDRVEGVRFAVAAGMLGLDRAGTAMLLNELVAEVRARKGAAPRRADEGGSLSDPAWLASLRRRWEPALAALVAAAGGDRQARRALEEYLDIRECHPEWAGLVTALRALLAGEHDLRRLAKLAGGFDAADSVIAAHALDALSGRVRLSATVAGLPAALDSARARRADLADELVLAAGTPAGFERSLAGFREFTGGRYLTDALAALLEGTPVPPPVQSRLTAPQAAFVRMVAERIAEHAAGRGAESGDGPGDMRDGGRWPRETPAWVKEMAAAAKAVMADGGGPDRADLQALEGPAAEAERAWRRIDAALTRRVAAGGRTAAAAVLQVAVFRLLTRHHTTRALPAVRRLLELLDGGGAGGDGTIPPVPGLAVLVDRAAGTAVAECEVDGELVQADVPRPRLRPVARGLRADAGAVSRAREWLVLAGRLRALDPDAEAEATLAVYDAGLSMTEGDAGRSIDRAKAAVEMLTVLPDAATRLFRARLLLARAFDMDGRPGEAVEQLTALIDGAAYRTQGPQEDDAVRARIDLLRSRAAALSRQGRNRGALADLHLALALIPGEDGALAEDRQESVATGDPWAAEARAAVLSQTGALHEGLGKAAASASAHLRALSIARSTGRLDGAANELLALGVLLGRLRNEPDGAELARVLLPVFPGAADQAPAGGREQPGPGELARWILTRAFDMFTAVNDPVGANKARAGLTNLLPPSEGADAIAVLEHVLSGQRKLGDLHGQAVTLANLAHRHAERGSLASAENHWRRSLAVSRPAGFFASAAQSARDLANLLRRTGRPAEAEALFRDAVEMTEAVRPEQPPDDASRIGFVRGKASAYVGLVECLLDRGADDEAFEIVQKAKSRALLDLLALAGGSPTAPPAGRFGELLAAEAAELALLRTQPAGETAVAAAERLAAVHEEMTGYDPAYVTMRRGAPATLDGMRTWLAHQGRPVLLVEYFLGEGGLTLFLLRAEWPEVKVHRSPLTTAGLARAHAHFQRDVIDFRNQGGNGWAELSQHITAPLREHLRPDDLVCLVPHRTLHVLPLHALPLDGEPLIARHPVVYAPTAGLLSLSEGTGRGTGRLDTCASFGVTFESEAAAVAAAFDDEPYITPHLTAETIQEHARTQDVIHFSSHAHFDAGNPLASGLTVREASTDGPDGARPAEVLTVPDIMRLRLDGELVTVSGCETGVGTAADGDELIGLVRAFLYAGPPSVIASLWPVDASVTEDLMVAFYRHLTARWTSDGIIDKAEALRQAQLEVMRATDADASYYWAPFILVGKWS